MKSKNKEINFKYEREQKVIDIANSSFEELANKLDSKIGLSPEDRQHNESKFGKNQTITKNFAHWKKILGVLVEPFNLLLLGIGLANFFIYFFNDREVIDLISGFIVISMIFLTGSVDYIQEYKAYKSNIELHKMVENGIWVVDKEINFSELKSSVSLKKNLIKIDQSHLTIGDVIYLNNGDVIPTDIRIIWSNQLMIDESTLTGESEALVKHTKNKNKQLLDLENIGFSQTIITNGSCFGVVINIAEQNYAISILKIAEEKNGESDYEKGLSKITKILVVSILSMIPIILLASGLRTGAWVQALIFSLSIAVSLTPEALPAIISSNLQLGAKKMAKNKVVVKNLAVVQNMGSVNVLCTDKTGTLTLDEVKLNDCVDINKTSQDQLNKLLFINSFLQQNLSNKIDQAVVKKLSNIQIPKNIKLLSEEPFSHITRCLSLLVDIEGKKTQISKGSVEEMLKMINFVNDNGQIVDFNKSYLLKINEQIEQLTKQGYRTLILASKKTDKITHKNLIFEGIVSFQEVIKPGIKKIIETIYKYNIDLKILTGDASNIATKIAELIKLRKIKTITGDLIQKLSKTELNELINTVNIFAKLSPLDKANIVNNLQSNKKVVAFLGDGVNDAVALKTADVGISVNNGTPLAKAAADVILLEKDLDVLEKSFIKGRQIFTNAIKYIKITVACNLGLMLTLLISTFWFGFEAMSPLQLLLQNLIYDFSNLVFVFDKVDDYSIKKPLSWNVKTIIPFAFWNGLVSTLISIVNFLIIGYVMGMFGQIAGVNGEFAIKQFQTMFFLESLFTHMVLIIVYRTEKISLIQSRPSWQLVAGMSFFAGIAFMITYIHQISHVINFEIPSSIWLAYLFGILLLAWIIGEIAKKSYIKIFKNWF